MNVDIFALCDFAQAERGKLYVMGAFHRITSKETPITYPLCALAIRMRFEKIEEGTKKIRISFIDSDGNNVMPTMEAEMEVRCPANESSATVPFALIIQQIRLPNFGEYYGRQEASTPLYVRKYAPPQQRGEPPGPSQKSPS